MQANDVREKLQEDDIRSKPANECQFHKQDEESDQEKV
jgi:hypothetical protein